MTIKTLAVPLVGAALIGGAVAGVGLTAFAESGSSSSGVAATATAAVKGFFNGAGDPGGDMRPGVSGTVTAVNGSTITLTGKDGGIYTIDASGSTVEKYANGSSSTVAVSSIAVGDTIMVNGQIKTATMTAKDIHDGVPPKPIMPVAVGKVTAVAGSTITLSGMAKPTTKGTKPTATTYTVDASNATITKIAASTTKGTKPTTTTIAAAGISVGDMLMVEGTANGTSIAATKITDGAGFGGMGRGPGKQ